MSHSERIQEAAKEWRCFHCDFVTTDRDIAEAHFGDRDDAEEFKPICKWWAHLGDDERVETLQDTIKELNDGAKENMRLLDRIEELETELSKHIPEQNEWVKVTDRLPGAQGEDSEDVMCFVNGDCDILDLAGRNGGGWGISIGFYDAEKRAFRTFGSVDKFVTHWMPLPTPPRSLATPSEPLEVTKHLGVEPVPTISSTQGAIRPSSSSHEGEK